ncbi:probable serine carboxypeptidase CPVL [Caerostris extrusa]|uniref:Probable serine carboxypeptidase CPVL n=1 Tax=Caerostris extrusa TaxID=172846 RepID=A0AAV4PC33_CAEEX|nr:probable serine carboxypeptidase CPVL [Caerostris extrusa]
MLWKEMTVFNYVAIFLCCVFANKIEAKPADFGEPLFLTPYIRSGNIKKAKDLSRVGKLPNAPQITSYSGFFTVNQKYNNNIFFWFFPALDNNHDAPVILWLQGGPGMTGLFGLFVEHGPYVIDSNMTAEMRPIHTGLSHFMSYTLTIQLVLVSALLTVITVMLQIRGL